MAAPSLLVLFHTVFVKYLPILECLAPQNWEKVGFREANLKKNFFIPRGDALFTLLSLVELQVGVITKPIGRLELCDVTST